MGLYKATRITKSGISKSWLYRSKEVDGERRGVRKAEGWGGTWWVWGQREGGWGSRGSGHCQNGDECSRKKIQEAPKGLGVWRTFGGCDYSSLVWREKSSFFQEWIEAWDRLNNLVWGSRTHWLIFAQKTVLWSHRCCLFSADLESWFSRSYSLSKSLFWLKICNGVKTHRELIFTLLPQALVCSYSHSRNLHASWMPVALLRAPAWEKPTCVIPMCSCRRNPPAL